MKDAQGHGSNGRGKYRGKYPNKIRAVSGGSGGHGFAMVETNSGERRSVHAKDTGGMYPKLGSDLNDYKHTSPDDYRSAQADSQAARALANGHPKSTVVGPHSAMAGSRSHDAFGRPRSAESQSEYDEYNRDLAHRARNGGIGSGGRR
jgi:hypothetical protein